MRVGKWSVIGGLTRIFSDLVMGTSFILLPKITFKQPNIKIVNNPFFIETQIKIEKWRTAQWTLNARCYAKLSCCNNNRIPFDPWTANTWDKKTFILFIFAFFIISELWKHINWSNNISKRSSVHLLQIKSFQRN